jgi:hypothetical protein
MKNRRWVLSTLTLVFALWSAPSFAAEMKEWTFLTFLNGHNNLDSYGEMNVNQMKEVGSNDHLNIVVQWASGKFSDTKRVYVKKGGYDVVQSMPRADMGDWRSLVEFVRWGAQNYPAKHYFVNVWNHGGGWHRIEFTNDDIHAQDISWDDYSGNHMTTEDLGRAMTEISQIIGQKVDIYGSDACLMAMAEVGAEMQDAVAYMVGSEEVEPGQGWPYNTFLARWAANPAATPEDVSKYLSDEYFKAYNGGIYGRQSVTFSAMDLSKLPAFEASIENLGRELGKLNSTQIKKVLSVAQSTQDYTYGDYKDAFDFVNRLETNGALAVDRQALSDVKASVSSLVIVNYASPAFSGSHGVSMWIPTSKYDWTNYSQRYQGLNFDRRTKWSSVLSRFF